MFIELYKIDELWQANMKDLPEFSPIGGGITKYEAVADLFFKLLHPIQSDNDWLKFINWNSFKIKVKKYE